MRVVAALVIDNNKKILLTQRPWHKNHGGFWEFPGGKVEAGESLQQALHRELSEELGIIPLSFSRFTQVKHNYGDNHVTLDFFLVEHFSGTASCRESQPAMSWVPAQDLNNYQFPEANVSVLEKIKNYLSLIEA